MRVAGDRLRASLARFSHPAHLGVSHGRTAVERARALRAELEVGARVRARRHGRARTRSLIAKAGSLVTRLVTLASNSFIKSVRRDVLDLLELLHSPPATDDPSVHADDRT